MWFTSYLRNGGGNDARGTSREDMQLWGEIRVKFIEKCWVEIAQLLANLTLFS